jgi:signal transduction histidine kinase
MARRDPVGYRVCRTCHSADGPRHSGIRKAAGRLRRTRFPWLGSAHDRGLAIVGIRRAPLFALALVVVAHGTYTVLDYPEGTEWLPTGVPVGGAAAAGFRWAAVLVGIAGVTSMVAFRVVDGVFEWLDAEVLLTAAGLSTALLAGEWLRARRDYVASAEQRARMAELGREVEARRRVNEERLRIAREMHDVLAHALASINVQAGGNPPRPSQTSRAGRGGVEVDKECRRRGPGGTSGHRWIAAWRRQKRQTRSARLVDRTNMQACGYGSTLGVSPTTFPRTWTWAAYRILQESITNSIRHAGPAQVTITLDDEPDRLRIRVEDDGAGAATPTNGTGRGIAGMRERAEAVGGLVEAGPLPDRGFAVRAVIPIEGTAS